MRGHRLPTPLHLLLFGLLAGCGSVPEAGLDAAALESLGTVEAAMCSGASVSNLTISGISTYQGEMAGGGDWAVTYPANAVHLDYYIDGVLQASDTRQSEAYFGTWSFSKSGVSCGSHTFEVRAYATVIYSGGNTVCWTSAPRSLSQVVSEPCPTCNGTPGQWAGCRGNGCAVCAEKLTNYPCYFQNHPNCARNTTCAGQFYTCNSACPAPTAADAC